MQKAGKKNRPAGGIRKFLGAGILALLAGGLGIAVQGYFGNFETQSPQELLMEYMSCIEEKDYETMYGMIDPYASGNISQEDFIRRNSNIYEGIEMRNMQIQFPYESEEGEDRKEGERDAAVEYICSFDTVAGEISFSNAASFMKGKEGYKLIWDDSLIFPGLEASDQVQVSSTKARRGSILDREGRMMAGQGTAVSVGLVPMRMEEDTIEETARLLDISEDAIREKLSVSWVKEDSFVPVKTIPKVDELELLSESADQELVQEYQRQRALLEIPGTQFQDVEIRTYPYGEAAAHLIGYVQNVTAEDLELHPGEGYQADSVIGRSGLEALFEKELRGRDGYEIWIMDQDGGKKQTLASCLVAQGEDIRLTIDAQLQSALYEQFQEDKGCSVAMNPHTGEVLALVSTPSYDNQLFVQGMSQEQWDELNEDERQPMYNRFRQTWCPGSTFKPIIAAVGLACKAIDPTEDYGGGSLSWQKDSTWGEYYVTTLHAAFPAILENAMMCSDNIYFAKAALKIGGKELAEALGRLGFGEELPFEITTAVSQYSNTETIDSEIQLADSGYGQGQILVNPIHLAALYTMFCNGGDVVSPRLLYQENGEPQIWISGAFSAQVIDEVRKGMDLVMNQPGGTGYGAHRDDVWLMGKTGTAEIKTAQDDVNGTELGWFAVFTADPAAEKPLLLVSMAEDVKERGGSGYVVEKGAKVLEGYFDF